MTEPRAAVTYCYRHPDREAYLRCNRCERVICPECMTEAAVGFQCPECVAQGRAEVRQPQTRFGAQVGLAPRVTQGLIGACVAIYALATIQGLEAVNNDFGSWGYGIALDGQTFRLFTAMFLHVSVFHLLFNMYALYILGPPLEVNFGHLRFAVLYLVAGLGGSVASYMFNSPDVVGVGASGAIFGLMGALLVAGRSLGVDMRQVLVLLVLNLGIGFVFPGIDWRAHLGGLVVGAAVAAAYIYVPLPALRPVGVVAIVVALAGLVLVRTAQVEDIARRELLGRLGSASSASEHVLMSRTSVSSNLDPQDVHTWGGMTGL